MNNKVLDFNKHNLRRITDSYLDKIEYEQSEVNPNYYRCGVPYFFTHFIDNDDDIEDLLYFYKEYLNKAYEASLRKCIDYVENNFTGKFILNIGGDEHLANNINKTLSIIESTIKGKDIGDIKIKEYLNKEEPRGLLGKKFIMLEIVYSFYREEDEIYFRIVGNNLESWIVDEDDKEKIILNRTLLLLDKPQTF